MLLLKILENSHKVHGSFGELRKSSGNFRIFCRTSKKLEDLSKSSGNFRDISKKLWKFLRWSGQFREPSKSLRIIQEVQKSSAKLGESPRSAGNSEKAQGTVKKFRGVPRTSAKLLQQNIFGPPLLISLLSLSSLDSQGSSTNFCLLATVHPLGFRWYDPRWSNTLVSFILPVLYRVIPVATYFVYIRWA